MGMFRINDKTLCSQTFPEPYFGFWTTVILCIDYIYSCMYKHSIYAASRIKSGKICGYRPFSSWWLKGAHLAQMNVSWYNISLLISHVFVCLTKHTRIYKPRHISYFRSRLWLPFIPVTSHPSRYIILRCQCNISNDGLGIVGSIILTQFKISGNDWLPNSGLTNKMSNVSLREKYRDGSPHEGPMMTSFYECNILASQIPLPLLFLPVETCNPELNDWQASCPVITSNFKVDIYPGTTPISCLFYIPFIVESFN